jgi:hypothetical protein
LPSSWGQRREDEEFVAMVHAYRHTGGVANADEVVRLLRKRAQQPISTLARWIVSRRAVSFSWQGQTLLPMFQFDPVDMSLRDSAREVVQELSGAFDDWGIAHWFARPNLRLEERAPVDVVLIDPAAVLAAAREDRFVVRG